MKKVILIFSLWVVIRSINAQDAIGIFEKQVDIGNTKAGTASYSTQNQDYTIEGSGNNVWFNHDGFHYVYRQMKGDFILRCNASLTGNGGEAHRKLGWMIRASLDSTAACVSLAMHGDGLTSLQYRSHNNDSMQEVKSSITKPAVLQLERRGTTFIMSVARDGETLTSDSIRLELGDNVYIGLFVCSHDANVTETGNFYNFFFFHNKLRTYSNCQVPFAPAVHIESSAGECPHPAHEALLFY